MPVITRHLQLPVSAADAFEYISAYENVTEWMFGIKALTPVGEVVRGVGDRFDATMTLGPKTFRAVVDVVEWQDGAVFALDSVDGFDTSSRWTVEPLDDTHSAAAVEFAYRFPHGFVGRTMARFVEPFVEQGITLTDRKVREQLTLRHTE